MDCRSVIAPCDYRLFELYARSHRSLTCSLQVVATPKFDKAQSAKLLQSSQTPLFIICDMQSIHHRRASELSLTMPQQVKILMLVRMLRLARLARAVRLMAPWSYWSCQGRNGSKANELGFYSSQRSSLIWVLLMPKKHIEYNSWLMLSSPSILNYVSYSCSLDTLIVQPASARQYW